MPEPLGTDGMDAVFWRAELLQDYVKDQFEPHQGVYRINDFGEYVSEDAWHRVWGTVPAWAEKAWMLADNGQYTRAEVAAMTLDEIEAAYDDPDFEPKYAFYTEADESGLL